MARKLVPGKRKKTKIRKERDPFSVNPKRDWKMLFLLSCLIAALLVGFHIFMFLKVVQGELFSRESGGGFVEETFDEELLMGIVENIEEKQGALDPLIAESLERLSQEEEETAELLEELPDEDEIEEEAPVVQEDSEEGGDVFETED